MRSTPTRREFVAQGFAAGLVVAGVPLVANPETSCAHPTPPNPLGPFYRSGAPARVKLVEAGDAGLPVVVRGKVQDLTGAPLREALVEIFHADPMGNYDVAGYRYRARLELGPDGQYEFETMMPGHYVDAAINPNLPRPEHIHYRIAVPGRPVFATQLYFITDPFFESDPERTIGKDPLVRHRDLIRPVELFVTGGKRNAAVRFDLCLRTA